MGCETYLAGLEQALSWPRNLVSCHKRYGVQVFRLPEAPIRYMDGYVEPVYRHLKKAHSRCAQGVDLLMVTSVDEAGDTCE